MSPADSNHVAQDINSINARRTRRAEAATHLVLLLLGVAAITWLLLQYLEPCEGAAMCIAVVTPTRTSLLHRMRLQLRKWRLKLLLADVHAALRRVEADLAELPHVREQLLIERDITLIRLRSIELDARQH